MDPTRNAAPLFQVLAEKAARGDSRAFQQIYDSIAGKMYSLCLRYAGNANDANDWFQEGFFKLYRNLDALYSVLGGVVESAGAFGPKDDFQSVSNDLSSFESARKQLAERLENLAGSKEQEILRLRTDLKTAQAAIPVTPPKKIVVDDSEPQPKKPPVKKKPAPKKPASTTAPGTTPPATQTPPAQPKPQ